MIFLITYELNNKDKDYDNLFLEIKRLGHWWHYIQNTWIINTTTNLEDCTRLLNSKIDENDRLLILDMTNIEMNGWLPEKAWEWIVRQKQRV